MLRFNVLQNEYLILALGCGLSIIFIFVLTFVTLKRPRSKIFFSEDRHSSASQSWGMMPWVLIITWVLTIIYGIALTIYKAIVPPNW